MPRVRNDGKWQPTEYCDSRPEPNFWDGNADSRISFRESVADAARLARVSERTVYRRLKDEAFVQRVNQARTSLLQQAVGRLAKAVPKASDVLDKLLDSEDERVRLQAAKAVLDSSVKLGDAVAYEERLAALESMLNMTMPRSEQQ